MFLIHGVTADTSASLLESFLLAASQDSHLGDSLTPEVLPDLCRTGSVSSGPALSHTILAAAAIDTAFPESHRSGSRGPLS